METKNKQLHIRITEKHKNELEKLSKERNVSITELILSGLKGLELRDYTHEKEFLTHLLGLTKELHHIGNNINQATIAIHQVNNGGRMPNGEFAAFNELLQQYSESRGTLSEQLSKIFFSKYRPSKD
jgi:hypothetical protein